MTFVSSSPEERGEKSRKKQNRMAEGFLFSIHDIVFARFLPFFPYLLSFSRDVVWVDGKVSSSRYRDSSQIITNSSSIL